MILAIFFTLRFGAQAFFVQSGSEFGSGSEDSEDDYTSEDASADDVSGI